MAFEHIGPIVGRVMQNIAAGSSASGSVRLDLTAPPSANRWWRRAGNRMHLSHEAAEYKQVVAWRLLNMGMGNKTPVFPTERLSVVVVWRRDRKAGDLDKRLGVILDALQETTIDGVHLPGLYASDAQVEQIWARRCDEHPELAPGTIRVEVCPIATEEPAS